MLLRFVRYLFHLLYIRKVENFVSVNAGDQGVILAFPRSYACDEITERPLAIQRSLRQQRRLHCLGTRQLRIEVLVVTG